MSNSGTTTQGKPGAKWKNMKLKAFIKSSNMSNSPLFPISFYRNIGVHWSSYTEKELPVTLCRAAHSSSRYTASTSACPVAKSS